MKTTIFNRMKQHTHAGLFFLAGVFLILVGPSLIPTSSAANNNIIHQFIDSNKTVHGALLNSGIFNLITDVPTGTYRVSVEYTIKNSKTIKIESSTFKYEDPTVQFNFNASGTNTIEVYSSNINRYKIQYRGKNNELLSSQRLILYGINGQKAYTTTMKRVTASIAKVKAIETAAKNANTTGAGTGIYESAPVEGVRKNTPNSMEIVAKAKKDKVCPSTRSLRACLNKIRENLRITELDSKVSNQYPNDNTASKTSESHQAAGSK